MAKKVCMSKGYTEFVIVNSWNPSTRIALHINCLLDGMLEVTTAIMAAATVVEI